MKFIIIILTCFGFVVEGFVGPLFLATATFQRKAPAEMEGVTKIEGIEIELPDLNRVFARIQRVSPLARQVIMKDRKHSDGIQKQQGFENLQKESSDLKWKKVEENKRKTIHQIEKIDNYMNLGSPLLRFRSSLKGPCLGDPFADFIMTLEQRKRWDKQIAHVDELYPVQDLTAVNAIMKLDQIQGQCTKLGVGYVQTKENFGISPREQLTLCGIQSFDDGSTLIWGTEMEEWHNSLLPEGQRHTRAKSHLFCTTLTPTGDDSFDVEYVLQMETGGNLPNWITTPVMINTVKSLFTFAEKFYTDESELYHYLLHERNTKVKRSNQLYP